MNDLTLHYNTVTEVVPDMQQPDKLKPVSKLVL